MFNFNNYSIKVKLLFTFIVFKILPLFLLASIGILSFLDIDDLLQNSSKEIIKKSQNSIRVSADAAIQDSIIALDKKSQKIIEEKTSIIANNVANFLHQRDEDILFLSKQKISQKNLEEFYKKKTAKQSPIFTDVKRHIVNVNKDTNISNKLLHEAKSLFANANIKVETKSLSGDSVEELIKYQNENNLDVIAMGAYSHNRFRSVIFGSFTTQMLLKSKKPLFLFR